MSSLSNFYVINISHIVCCVYVRYYHSHLSCDDCFNEKNVRKWKMPALSPHTAHFFISFVSITKSKFVQEEAKFVRIIKEYKFLWIIKNLCVRFTDYLWMWGEYNIDLLLCERRTMEQVKNVKWQKREKNLFNRKGRQIMLTETNF